MIPLRDDVDCETTPYVNYLLMGVCSLVFLLQLQAGDGNNAIVDGLGMVPARLTADPGEPVLVVEQVLVDTPLGIQTAETVRELAPAFVPEWLTLVTCVFLHGGWMHFLGNMWFLFVFGDNVEDRLGHLAFAALYIGTGLVAGLCHLVVHFDSPAPTIGASGAIAGVMGAYLWMFPKSKVLTLVPLLFFWPIFVLPGPVFLTIWFLMQISSGALSFSGSNTGVAWWAHIGGFAAGLACGAALGRETDPPKISTDQEIERGQSW